ncbi:MAG: serine/threonine-protein phosphatase, partial [Anaerotignaceae bacterium]
AYLNPGFSRQAYESLREGNAAALLARLLIENCDKLNIWIGQAVNPAHQENNFPMDFNFKINQLRELGRMVEKMGKEVKINYI